MEIEPVTGTPVRIPPGRVAVRFNEGHRRAYRALYAHYQTVLDGLPILREGDFDGRRVTLAPKQLGALNDAFAKLAAVSNGTSCGSAFAGQERSKNRLFKRLQYLS